jgi:hypothetical protein
VSHQRLGYGEHHRAVLQNDCLGFLGRKFDISIDRGFACADDRCELARLPDVAMRNRWRAVGVQQRFRLRPGHLPHALVRAAITKGRLLDGQPFRHRTASGMIFQKAGCHGQL